MADPSPRRVEELFDQALDLDPARRACSMRISRMAWAAAPKK